MTIRPAVVGFAIALALSAPAGYALQEFTLDEARTRIERLEVRVSSLEATIAAGVAATPEAQEMHNVTGVLLLVDQENFAADTPLNPKVGESCTGYGGYDDIGYGASIRALDEEGDIIGSDALPDLGEVVRVRTQVLGCEFHWSIDVEDADFYVFEIANRGAPSFSRADLEATDWMVSLTIGD
jgi:hypothetical protein